MGRGQRICSRKKGEAKTALMTPSRSARVAQKEELVGALALLFARLPQRERQRRVIHALELLREGELDARGVFVVPGDRGPAGVFVCQPVAGAGGLVWPPVVACEEGEELEDSLIERGCSWLRQRGVRLAQCLLAPEERGLEKALLRNGFAAVTGLTYLRHEESLSVEMLAETGKVSWETYNQEAPSEFHRTMERTYEQTLDCPEVNGLRSMEEVIQGHQAQGRFDARNWWMARRAGKPVGVLLLVEQGRGEWEVAYMGVVPEARRQGIGRALLQHALCEARAAGVGCVHLSVDDRNEPARRLYEGMGFVPYDHRQVLLRIWGPPTAR